MIPPSCCGRREQLEEFAFLPAAGFLIAQGIGQCQSDAGAEITLSISPPPPFLHTISFSLLLADAFLAFHSAHQKNLFIRQQITWKKTKQQGKKKKKEAKNIKKQSTRSRTVDRVCTTRIVFRGREEEGGGEERKGSISADAIQFRSFDDDKEEEDCPELRLSINRISFRGSFLCLFPFLFLCWRINFLPFPIFFIFFFFFLL